MEPDSNSESYENAERLVNAARGSRLAQLVYEFREYFENGGGPESDAAAALGSSQFQGNQRGSMELPQGGQNQENSIESA